MINKKKGKLTRKRSAPADQDGSHTDEEHEIQSPNKADTPRI